VIQYGEKEKSEKESSEEEGQEESSEEEDQEESNEEKSYQEESQEKSQEESNEEKSYQEESQEKKEKIGRKKRYGGFRGSERRETKGMLPGILLDLEFGKSRDEIRQATLACVKWKVLSPRRDLPFFYLWRRFCTPPGSKNRRFSIPDSSFDK